MNWAEYRKEAVDDIRNYRDYLIRTGMDGTVEYDEWMSAETNAECPANDRPGHGAIALLVIYERMRGICASETGQVWQMVAQINALGDGLVWSRDLPVDDGTAEAWQRVHDELYPDYKDLIIVGLSAAFVARRLREILRQRLADAKEAHERELTGAAKRNRRANVEVIRSLASAGYDPRGVGDREVQALADRLRNEWRVQNDAERMEDIAHA